jgi:hypothetical protein
MAKQQASKQGSEQGRKQGASERKQDRRCNHNCCQPVIAAESVSARDTQRHRLSRLRPLPSHVATNTDTMWRTGCRQSATCEKP